jgi:FKBP-type peptidyl-prolyl cis-trans isomerase (trigger factor)
VKVSTQRLPESQVLPGDEVDLEQMERSLDKAQRRLAQRVEVPGFRKAKRLRTCSNVTSAARALSTKRSTA